MKKGIVIESNAEYHGDMSAISKSRLAKMAVCPRYFKWCEEHPQEPTQALIFGSAFHKFLLEKDEFEKEFAVLPVGIDRRTKAGKEAYDLFMLENEGKAIITQADLEMIVDMCKSITENKYAAQLLKGEHEQSMYFTDELTQVQCKVRPDVYRVFDDEVVITDFKSVKSAVAEKFINDVIKYGYDLQAYMYRLGVAITLGVPTEKVSFVFIPVEKEPPYLTAVYEVTQDIFDRGEMLFRKYIGTYKECEEANNWYSYNGFTNAPIRLGLPDWVTKNNKNGEE